MSHSDSIWAQENMDKFGSHYLRPRTNADAVRAHLAVAALNTTIDATGGPVPLASCASTRIGEKKSEKNVG
jgi:hypothetical protein